jgi:hypothetical protein
LIYRNLKFADTLLIGSIKLLMGINLSQLA